MIGHAGGAEGEERGHTHVTSKETKNSNATFVYARAAVFASFALRRPWGVALRRALPLLDPGLGMPNFREYELTEMFALPEMLRYGAGLTGF